MAKSFLIVIGSKLGTRQELTDLLNTLPSVTYWYACLPNCVFVNANATANDLFKNIDVYFKNREGRKYLVTEVGEDRQGLLPPPAWRVLKYPDDPRTSK